MSRDGRWHQRVAEYASPIAVPVARGRPCAIEGGVEEGRAAGPCRAPRPGPPALGPRRGRIGYGPRRWAEFRGGARHCAAGKDGLEAAIYEKARSGADEVLTAATKQRIIAMVCSRPPDGAARWTTGLIAEEAIKRKLVPTVGRETIRILLKPPRPQAVAGKKGGATVS